jgi:hypothetical protein
MNILMFIMCVAIGVVDQIDNGVASVEVNNGGQFETIEVPLKDIPCTVREGGEILFTVANDGSEKIRCLK